MRHKRGFSPKNVLEATAPSIVGAHHDEPKPLSFQQEGLWLSDQLDTDTSAYRHSSAHRLSGELDVGALKRAFHEVVWRHEILRTAFVSRNGRLEQVVAPMVPWKLPVVDLEGLPSAVREERMRRLVREESEKAFDLGRSPLMRSILIRTQPAEHVLVLTLHHVVTDNWSQTVLYRELGALYAAFSRGATSPLAELPLQYGDYAVWQRRWLQGEVLESWSPSNRNGLLRKRDTGSACSKRARSRGCCLSGGACWSESL